MYKQCIYKERKTDENPTFLAMTLMQFCALLHPQAGTFQSRHVQLQVMFWNVFSQEVSTCFAHVAGRFCWNRNSKGHGKETLCAKMQTWQERPFLFTQKLWKFQLSVFFHGVSQHFSKLIREDSNTTAWKHGPASALKQGKKTQRKTNNKEQVYTIWTKTCTFLCLWGATNGAFLTSSFFLLKKYLSMTQASQHSLWYQG